MSGLASGLGHATIGRSAPVAALEEYCEYLVGGRQWIVKADGENRVQDFPRWRPLPSASRPTSPLQLSGKSLRDQLESARRRRLRELATTFFQTWDLSTLTVPGTGRAVASPWPFSTVGSVSERYFRGMFTYSSLTDWVDTAFFEYFTNAVRMGMLDLLEGEQVALAFTNLKFGNASDGTYWIIDGRRLARARDSGGFIGRMRDGYLSFFSRQYEERHRMLPEHTARLREITLAHLSRSILVVKTEEPFIRFEDARSPSPAVADFTIEGGLIIALAGGPSLPYQDFTGRAGNYPEDAEVTRNTVARRAPRDVPVKLIGLASSVLFPTPAMDVGESRYGARGVRAEVDQARERTLAPFGFTPVAGTLQPNFRGRPENIVVTTPARALQGYYRLLGVADHLDWWSRFGIHDLFTRDSLTDVNPVLALVPSERLSPGGRAPLSLYRNGPLAEADRISFGPSRPFAVRETSVAGHRFVWTTTAPGSLALREVAGGSPLFITWVPPAGQGAARTFYTGRVPELANRGRMHARRTRSGNLQFDWVFADRAARGGRKGRAYRFEFAPAAQTGSVSRLR